MEPEVHIRCRKSDEQIVAKVYKQAGDEYKALMQKEVKRFTNKDIPLTIVLETHKFLPEFNPNKSESATDSCLGGIVLHARKGRIVCSNTLDERLQLVY